MQIHQFEAKKFIAKGNYSLVYQVIRKGDVNKGRKYALKRYFLRNEENVIRALRERKVLEKILNPEWTSNSPFLPTLFSAFWMGTSVAMVITAGCGMDLCELRISYPQLSESSARFYCAEILCGLEHLHTLKIVHMDLKPGNVLIMTSGHVMITDFDHSLDISSGPSIHPDRLAGTLLYNAPEVTSQELIDEKADIWSWASILVELVGDTVRDHRLLKQELVELAIKGQVSMRGFKRYSNELQNLVTACFMINPQLRPNVSEIKMHPFFKDLDWDDVVACRMEPPLNISKFHFRAAKRRNGIEASNRLILKNLYELEMINANEKFTNPDKTRAYRKFEQNIRSLVKAGISESVLRALFANFNFEHPHAFTVKGDY
ncbi:unnamed protein product [Hymenolepis diminuta]|uniref:Protein kinase domain-containing protein n=1 Tax=Hymenolepis diminuta TaxID=6216 RepID=A0A564XW27_HYMDI|nr:unnamed protein product [Hymenolepis diminuta]